ncbi:MAG: type IV-A pilus assembly ATPase PilB [Mycobacteriaceae bacterium]|nr:type IV-A pilus assembly ATPase PilB [Mycobacteriaceae bacterium]
MPVFAARAAGGIIEDVDGNRFIDLGSGIAVTTIGNAAPRVVEAVREQVADFTHTCFMVTPYEEYVAVAEHLNRLTPGSFEKRTALFNSGAEAVENAVKIARSYTHRTAVVAFDHAYHGRTNLTMGLTAKSMPYKSGFGPFAPEIYRAPMSYPYRDGLIDKEWATDGELAAERALTVIDKQIGAANLAALIIEPIQGEGGFIVPAPGFLPALRAWCTENDVVFIADEVQSGIARTGQWFACEDEGIELDGLELGNTDDDIGENISRDDIEDAPIVRFVNKLMLDAIRRGASDIHFEPFEKMYRVRMRVDGVLREVTQPPVQLGGRLAARIKVMSRMDIAERRVPQDGRIKLRLNKARAIDFRVSTCPTLYGEKVVMRILDASQAMLGIDALGYEGFQKDLYLAALAKPQGMILVTGPTGSGKTVSLYTGLGILNRGDLNISTAEDPVEINLQGINQVNVNNKVGLSFAAALRAFLRQDPDVVMVGEIRDLETAEIALKAAQTGHLVLSTLHTNDAPQTLTRLIDMGVKPYALATSMSLIIAQRLARRLCQNCRELLDIPPDALRKEGFPEEAIANGLRVFGPRGCDSCTDGYKGRIGVYQVMPVTDEIGRLIMAGGNAHDIADAAKRNNIWDLRRSGLAKVMSGLTSIEEINSVTIE